MHDLEFAEAFCPPKFTVLGLDLLNYTIGHALVLTERQNPLLQLPLVEFSHLKVLVQFQAIEQAVLICCRRRPRFHRWWRKKAKWMELGGEANKFRAYLAANSKSLPTVPQPRVKGAPFHYFGGPELAQLLNYVTTQHAGLIVTHFEGSPLNFPLGLARMLFLSHLEASGAIWIKNFQDFDHEDRLKAFERENPESQFAMGDEAVEKLKREFMEKYGGEGAKN